MNSKNVSAHYVVSKSGEIVQILDPMKYTAWHTGRVSSDKYTNSFAIGVEVHYTVGEGFWTGYMFDAITYLAQMYPDCEVVTHREIAVPNGRKIDPSGFSDYWFDYWRANRTQPYSLYTTPHRSNVREKPSTSARVVTTLPEGSCVFSFDKDCVTGQAVRPSFDKWRYVLGLGFIYEPLLDKIQTLE